MTQNQTTLTYEELLAAISAPEGQGAELKDPATGAVVGRAPQASTADLGILLCSSSWSGDCVGGVKDPVNLAG